MSRYEKIGETPSIEEKQEKQEGKKQEKKKKLLFDWIGKKLEKFIGPLLLFLVFHSTPLKAERGGSDIPEKIIKTVELYQKRKKESAPRVIKIEKSKEFQDYQKKVLEKRIRSGMRKPVELEDIEREYPNSYLTEWLKNTLRESRSLGVETRSLFFKQTLDFFNDLFSYFNSRPHEFSEEDKEELVLVRQAFITEFLQQNPYHPGVSLDRVIKDAQRDFEITPKVMEEQILAMTSKEAVSGKIGLPNIEKSDSGEVYLSFPPNTEISMLIGSAKVEGLEVLDFIGNKFENVVSLKFVNPDRYQKFLIMKAKEFADSIKIETGLKYQEGEEEKKLEDDFRIFNAILESAEHLGEPVKIELSNGKTVEISFKFDLEAGKVAENYLCGGNYAEFVYSQGEIKVEDTKSGKTKKISCGRGWEFIWFLPIPIIWRWLKRRKKESEEKEIEPTKLMGEETPSEEVKGTVGVTGVTPEKVEDLSLLQEEVPLDKMTPEELSKLINGSIEESIIWLEVLKEREAQSKELKRLEKEIASLEKEIKSMEEEIIKEYKEERGEVKKLKEKVLEEARRDQSKIEELTKKKEELEKKRAGLAAIKAQLNRYKEKNLELKDLAKKIEASKKEDND
jgi:hypothetical protein